MQKQKQIGKALQQKRKTLGLTQEELAHMVGYKSKTAISKIELGRKIPSDKCIALANILDMDVLYLLGQDVPPNDIHGNDNSRTMEVEKMVAEINSLPDSVAAQTMQDLQAIVIKAKEKCAAT